MINGVIEQVEDILYYGDDDRYRFEAIAQLVHCTTLPRQIQNLNKCEIPRYMDKLREMLLQPHWAISLFDELLDFLANVEEQDSK